MKNKELQNIINNLIDYYLRSNSTGFNKIEVNGAEVLLRNKVLLSVENDRVEINFKSLVLGEYLLNSSEIEINDKVDINEIFNSIDNYYKKIKTDNPKFNFVNAYSLISENLSFFILYNIHTSGKDDVIKIFKNQIKISDSKSFSHSKKNAFFNSLPFLIKDSNEIYNTLLSLDSKDYSYYLNNYCLNLAKTKPEIAYKVSKLYRQDRKNVDYLESLLVGLYLNSYLKSFKIISDIKNENLMLFYSIAIRLRFKTKKHLEVILNSLNKLDFIDKNIGNKQALLISNLIEDPICTDVQIESLWLKLKDFVEGDNFEISGYIMFNLIDYIEGFEDRKYKLLFLYIPKSKNFKVLNKYFNNFSNTFYLIDWIIKFTENIGIPNIKHYETAIRNLWNIDKENLEADILNFFNFGNKFGTIALKIMFCGYNNPLEVNFNKIETKEAQFNAIQCICKFPHSIDKLLPYLLIFRNSVHKEVVQFLQINLSRLILEAYGPNLLNMVNNAIEIRKNDKFLTPLNKTIKEYERIELAKKSINDCNPFLNERSLIDLYYRLEQEETTKMMDKANKTGPITSMFKTQAIVRGNSWKINDDRDVTPLGHFESEITIDIRAYKDPDLYEFNLKQIWN